ncbi:MAG: hypothetical protein ACE3JQ_02405 [Paenisporosarcina sp.]
MFPLELLNDLKEELQTELSGMTFINANETNVPFNIYQHRLPYKESEKDSAHFPFILLKIVDGNIDGETEAAVSSIVIVVGLIDESLDNQGHVDVINVLEKIYQYIVKKRTFSNKYSLTFPIRYQLDDEDYHPFHFGYMETNWEMMRVDREDDFI